MRSVCGHTRDEMGAVVGVVALQHATGMRNDTLETPP